MSPDARPTAPRDWAQVLDELERHADAPGLAAGWEAPAELGPLPDDLAARAQELVTAQQRAIRRLTDQRRRVAAHLDAVDVIAPARSRAVYLDLDA
ncbi:hypothetical protein [Mesorhizobium japonicum]|uniref:hypothetical protein n=1 Tax=Mesorhizobium japonicum TaxID=2066070 RepID=UPI003B5AB3B5